jgi:hypothetical protein
MFLLTICFAERLAAARRPAFKPWGTKNSGTAMGLPLAPLQCRQNFYERITGVLRSIKGRRPRLNAFSLPRPGPSAAPFPQKRKLFQYDRNQEKHEATTHVELDQRIYESDGIEQEQNQNCHAFGDWGQPFGLHSFLLPNARDSRTRQEKQKPAICGLREPQGMCNSGRGLGGGNSTPAGAELASGERTMSAVSKGD